MTSEALAQKTRQLNLVLELDAVRDRLEDDGDPQQMFNRIAEILREQFEADACGLMLLAETTDDIECIAVIGAPQDSAVELCRAAIALETPAALKTKLWSHTLAVRVILNKDEYPLGSMFIGRRSRAFDEVDQDLLVMAESQIDSAVIQARTIWKLAQRNRELEAIFQIDRLRDNAHQESELISGFTNILQEHFNAELCMILLSLAESGDLIVRGVVDKSDLSAAALEAIRDTSNDILIPQVIPTPPGIKDLTLLAAPFIVSGVRLGAVVLGRKQPFSVADHRLMYAMTSQMDSAVAHSRVNQELFQRHRELEAIYRIDQIRDRENDFDAMLQSVLAVMCEAISSELGYLMLYSEKSESPLESKAETFDGLLSSPEYKDMITRMSRRALDSAELVYSNSPEGVVRSIVAIPLILNEKIIGVFGAINSSNSRGFSAEDRRMLTAITSQVDTAVVERLVRRRMRKVLSRQVDPKVLEHLLQRADDNVLAGERVVLSVLFADLRGSTEWAERTEPEELVQILNEFLGKMTDVIFKYGGTLDKFVGDEVIGLFGSPISMQDHALKAARAGLEMQIIHQELRNHFQSFNQELPPMGVGISSGEVIAGEFGPPIRTDFTAMGRVMNLGARLCSAATAGQVIISPSTHYFLRDKVEAKQLGTLELKGIGQPVPILELLKIKD